MTGLDGVGGLVGRAPFVLRTFPPRAGETLSWPSVSIAGMGKCGDRVAWECWMDFPSIEALPFAGFKGKGVLC